MIAHPGLPDADTRPLFDSLRWRRRCLSVFHHSRRLHHKTPAVSADYELGPIDVLTYRKDWSVLTEDLAFLYLDPELTHHIGPLAESLLGRSIFDLAHPQDIPTARENVRHLQTEQSFNGSVFW
jgi:hypothetical protein